MFLYAFGLSYLEYLYSFGPNMYDLNQKSFLRIASNLHANLPGLARACISDEKRTHIRVYF